MSLEPTAEGAVTLSIGSKGGVELEEARGRAFLTRVKSVGASELRPGAASSEVTGSECC